MGEMSVAEVAAWLGITQRQVRNLATGGQLERTHRGLIDEQSVAFYEARGHGRVRVWDPPSAWAAIAILTGQNPAWLGQTQRSRLRRALRSMSPRDLVVHTRNRATVHRYTGLDEALRRASAEIIDTSSAAAALGMSGTMNAEGYASTATLADLTRRYRLHNDPRGRLIIHATAFDIAIVQSLIAKGTVVAALDLAASPDTREQQAGLNALADICASLNPQAKL